MCVNKKSAILKTALFAGFRPERNTFGLVTVAAVAVIVATVVAVVTIKPFLIAANKGFAILLAEVSLIAPARIVAVVHLPHCLTGGALRIRASAVAGIFDTLAETIAVSLLHHRVVSIIPVVITV